MNVILALVVLAALTGLFVGFGRGRGIISALERAEAPPLPAAEVLPGGDPSRAIVVASPVVIERHAERWPCPVCEGAVRCEHHRVEQIADQRQRVARVRCPRCGFERDVYFVLDRSPDGLS